MKGEWKFEYEAPIGERVLKRFRSCTNFEGLWWCNEKKKFVPLEEKMPRGGSNHSPPIRTLKAFKRFLKRHTELNGVEVILCSRFVGHNVFANWHAEETL